MEHPQLPSEKKKLEWVTPKISLMEAGDTEGKGFRFINEPPKAPYGPS